MKLYLLLAIIGFSISLQAQTYIVKDQYGYDTGIRIEKKESPYLQGFQAGYGQPLDYTKKGNTIIINNYSNESGSNLSPRYSRSSSTGYSKRQKKRAQRWAKRKFERKPIDNYDFLNSNKSKESKETKTPPKEKKVISRISDEAPRKVKNEFNFSKEELTDFVIYCNMDDFLYSYPEFSDKYKVLEINKGEIVRIVKGEIEFTFWQKVYFKENVGYVHKSFFNSQEPISNYQ